MSKIEKTTYSVSPFQDRNQIQLGYPKIFQDKWFTPKRGVADPVSLNFQVDQDPDPGFDDQNLKKSFKQVVFLKSQIAIYLFLGLLK
jgi:hypothetical protein